VTPIRKLLRRLPSLRRKRSSRTKSSRSVTEVDVRMTPAWSEFSPTRRQSLSYGHLSARPSSTRLDQPESHCSNPLTRLKWAKLAIQQYDQVCDAIVVSTLPCYPFCCHRDLLTMSRPRLLQAAYLFNSCLPFCARFTDLEVSSDAHIRRRIEQLVGIVSGPTGDRDPSESDIQAISDCLEQCELDEAISPPSSPSATYPSRGSGVFSPHRTLDVVVEEDEREFSSYRRTVKKRKVDNRRAEPSRVSLDHRSWEEM
jgi:hypothetical protein